MYLDSTFILYKHVDGYLVFRRIDDRNLYHIEKHGRITVYNPQNPSGGQIIKPQNFAVYQLSFEARTFLNDAKLQIHPKDFLLTYPEYFV